MVYNIYLPLSNLPYAEAIQQFLTLPYAARIEPFLQWDRIPEYATVRFHVPSVTAHKYRFIGHAKRSSMVALIERLRRPRPGSFYVDGLSGLIDRDDNNDDD
jgi:hypothetical protein